MHNSVDSVKELMSHDANLEITNRVCTCIIYMCNYQYNITTVYLLKIQHLSLFGNLSRNLLLYFLIYSKCHA